MKSHTKYLTFTVPARMDFVNITDTIAGEVSASGVQEGLCLVNAMHITASVFINDDEPGLLHADYKRWLEKLAPPSMRAPRCITTTAPGRTTATPITSAR